VRGVGKKKLRLVPYSHPWEQDHGEQDVAGQEREGLGEYRIGIEKMEFQERLIFH